MLQLFIILLYFITKEGEGSVLKKEFYIFLVTM